MRAIQFVRPGYVQWVNFPALAETTAIRPEIVGICGTDRHIYAGRLPAPSNSILGHEIIGHIAQWTPNNGVVADWDVKVGDRVVIAPGINCGRCYACTHYGMYCQARQLYGLTMAFHPEYPTGGFATSMPLQPGTWMFRVPDDLPARKAVFIELMACVVSAMKRAIDSMMLLSSQHIAVVGFGPAGLCAATLAATAGAVVSVIEPDAERRAIASTMGFAVLDPQNVTPYEIAALHGTSHLPIDIVVECAGTPTAFLLSLDMVRTGGRIVEMGTVAKGDPLPIDISAICQRDIQIIGSCETSYGDFHRSIDILRRTTVNITQSINQLLYFDTIRDPNQLFTQPNVMKGVVCF